MVEEKEMKQVPIQTSSGVRYVSHDQIIDFPGGLPGFREFTRFVVFDIDGCEPFKSLLSVDAGGPDFVVVESGKVVDDYNPLDFVDSSESLGLGETGEFIALSIVTVEEDFKQSTINLRGPIIYNIASSKARQVILPDDRFSTKTPLLPA